MGWLLGRGRNVHDSPAQVYAADHQRHNARPMSLVGLNMRQV